MAVTKQPTKATKVKKKDASYAGISKATLRKVRNFGGQL